MTEFNNILPTFYLALLISLLTIAGVFLLRQILKTRRIENAISRLQAKLAKEKGTAQEYYELGSIYLDKNLFAQAIVQLQKALKAPDLEESESALVYNALGFAYFSQEQYDLAIRQYKEALKVNPAYISALNNLGHAYERKQLIAPALEAYEQVLQADPKNVIAQRRSDSLRKRVIPSTSGS
ncbi:MAG: tetratricopeptide repeat protein [Leptolyngbyaceae bacterium]|nr:tetratricopeptide repeat protein [Leptolyngbyaceae bacterium]